MRQLFLTLHILCVIVGFGGVTLNGMYAIESRDRRGVAGLAVFEANEKVTAIAQYFIYGVFATGFLLPFTFGGDVFAAFAAPWLSASMTLYVVMLGIVFMAHRPNLARIHELKVEVTEAGPPTEGPPPQAAELAKRGKRAAAFGMVLNLTMVVILVLMVTKPG